MFTTLQLRLCCLSAMAPALTEAASQAQNFKLPYTPPASAQNLSGSSIVVVNRLRLQNCRTSCVDFQQPSDPTEFFTENLMQNKGVISSLVIEGNDSDKPLLLTDNYDLDDIFLDNSKLSLFDLDFITDTEDLIEETPLKHLSCFERQKHCSFIHTMNSIKNNKNLNAMGISKTSVNLQLTAERDKLLNIVNSSIMQHPSNNLIPCVDMYTDFTGQTELDSLTKYSTGENQESEVTKCTLINDRLQETYARQINLERRSERLMRRIQKLQAHQVEVHVSSQLAAFVEYQQKTLNLPSKKERMQHGLRSSNASSSSSSTSSVDIKAEILQSEKVKSLSTAALVNLVRKLESSHGSALRQKYVSFQNLRTSEKHDSSSTEIKLPKEVCSEMNRVAGTLQRDIRHLQRAIDSDATESSSGGESCDEMDGYDEKKTRLVPVYKRAKWKWSVDRAAIGSRWTWLKAQVSDLEYRIRQQNEIYRQLRATKGPVILGEGSVLEDSSESKASQNSSDLSRLGHKKLNSIEAKLINLERHSDLALASILGNDAKSLLVQSVGIGVQNYSRHSTTPVNGFVTSGNTGSPSCEPTLTNDSESDRPLLDSNAGSASTLGEQTSPNNDAAGFTACRVRPLQSFRKRKILRTAGINYANRKAAKLTNVMCGCLPQVTACILCGGRLNLNYMQSLDTETMSTEERIGLLDPSFHSILSFDQDISLAFHLEALLKSGEWQKGAQKSKPLAANRKKAARLSTQVKDVCKHSRKLKKNAAATLTAKLKKKFTEDKRPRGRGVSARMSNQEGAAERVRKRNNASHVSLALKKRERSFSGSSGSSSKPTSPIPSPVLTDHSMLQVESGVQSFSSGNFDQRDHHRKSSFSQDIMRRRRGESAFDINNIVIPYSMAAATRVERLQYKEILTPKWRLIEDAAKEKEETIANNLCKNNGLVASTEEFLQTVDPNCYRWRLIEDAAKEREESIANNLCKNNGLVASTEESHEDISDEAVTVRHDKCEQEEKKRFMSYVHTQWNTRGRSRSIRDSRADSSGANTPDPLSPYPFEHHDSPLTTPPSTPAPCVDEGNSNLGSRRRTTSLTKRDRLFEDFRSSTPEIEEEPVLPWESRTFPLADKDYEDLVANNSHSSFTTSWEPPAPVSYDNNEPESKIDPCSRPSTPSSSSGSVGDDDPNDPEWTVASVPAEKSPRPGIVIKLAKR